MPSHQDLVAVVTGAARGIGQAISRGLAERGALVDVPDGVKPASSMGRIPSRVALRAPAVGGSFAMTFRRSTFQLGSEATASRRSAAISSTRSCMRSFGPAMAIAVVTGSFFGTTGTARPM